MMVRVSWDEDLQEVLRSRLFHVVLAIGGCIVVLISVGATMQRLLLETSGEIVRRDCDCPSGTCRCRVKLHFRDGRVFDPGLATQDFDELQVGQTVEKKRWSFSATVDGTKQYWLEGLVFLVCAIVGSSLVGAGIALGRKRRKVAEVPRAVALQERDSRSGGRDAAR